MSYKTIIKALEELKEECLSVTCEECIFCIGHDVCLLSTLPASYDLKEIKKVIRDYEKLQNRIKEAGR